MLDELETLRATLARAEAERDAAHDALRREIEQRAMMPQRARAALLLIAQGHIRRPREFAAGVLRGDAAADLWRADQEEETNA